MANVSGFKASLTNGGVRATNFEVQLNFPAFVQGGTDATKLASFHCKATSLPDSQVAAISVMYQGRAVHVAGERQFSPWEVTIINEDFRIRDALERWMHGYNDLATNGGIIQPALYQTDMQVIQYDRNGTVLKTIKIVDAFPIQVGPIQLSYDAANQIEEFQVLFSLDSYESSGINL